VITSVVQLERCSCNPVLQPLPGTSWESRAVFNPAAVTIDGTVHLLYRAVGYTGQFLSRLGLATSDDGVTFSRASPDPVFGPEEPYERWSIEDPRLVHLVHAGGHLLLTYVVLMKPALSYGQQARTALASTTDLRSFTRYGLISPPLPELDDRNMVLFPEQIGGRYVALRRPQRLFGSDYVEYGPQQEHPNRSSIWISFSQDVCRWEPGHRLLRPERWWEARKIGPGPPPVRTERGWLLVYHGVDERGVYRAGAALLDLEHPDRVLARLPYPILEPEEPYEKDGVTPNVVFPEGTATIDGRLLVYYGAADTVCAMAGIGTSKLLDALARHPEV
jgi:beta-1,2-mannobiose phosphorylase / 1,2-beta-oligomannan phosphorylase